MTSDFVGAQIRRTNRNLLFTAIVCSLVVVAALAAAFATLGGDINEANGGTLFFVLAAAGFLWGAISSFRKRQRRLADPSKHPITEWLASYGDPAEISQQIDAEIRQAAPLRFGSALVTESWVLVPSSSTMLLMNLNFVAWVYQKVTSHSTNGIPTGKTYQTCFRSKGGAQFDLKMPRKQAEALLGLVRDRQPWVVVGFNNEILNAYSSDRANFVAAIDQRRNELENRRPITASG